MANRVINQQLVDDIRDVLQQAEELLESTADVSGKNLEVARQKVADGMAVLRTECSRLQRKAGEAAHATRQVVKEHPYETAGAGLVLLACVAGALWVWQRGCGSGRG